MPSKTANEIIGTAQQVSLETVEHATSGELHLYAMKMFADDQQVVLHFVQWPGSIYGVIATDPTDTNAWHSALISIYRQSETVAFGAFFFGVRS